MKKILIIIGIVILILLCGWFVFMQKSTRVYDGVSDTTSTSTSKETSVHVTVLHNNVSYKGIHDATYHEVQDSIQTPTGTYIKTSSDGRALIESIASHTTVLDYNTEIILAENSDPKKTQIELLSGAVWSRLQKIFDSGEFYEIKTGNAVAVVRGTSFGLWFKNGITTLIVTEGVVGLSLRDLKTGEAVSGSEVLVHSGQKAVLKQGSAIVVYPISTSDKKEPWYVFNNPVQTQSSTAQTVATPTTATSTISASSTPTSPAVTITSLTPSTVEAGKIVTIKGTGFTRIKSIIIGNTSIQNFSIISPTSIQCNTGGLSTGTYSVSIIDIENNVITGTNPLTITAVQPTISGQTPTANLLYPLGQ